MPTIQIDSYSFTLSDPFAEGHVLTLAEAKALNGVRSERLRNIIYKRLKAKGNAMTTPAGLRDFEVEVALLDEEFSFQPHASTRVLRNNLQSEILEVARESVRASYRTNGMDITDEAMEQAALLLITDLNIIEEGQRRYAAHQEVTKNALADLMSS